MIRLLYSELFFKLPNYGTLRNLYQTFDSPLNISKSCFPKTFFHSSCNRFSEISAEDALKDIEIPRRVSPAEAQKIARDKVDWLPFPWTRPPKHDRFVDSGDLVKELEYDPSWPKPDFEYSDELKTANDEIKHKYSLATASKAEIKEVIKRRWYEKIQRHPNDFESLEVRVAERTLRIRSLFEHTKVVAKDVVGGRIILYITINRRNKGLKNIYRTDLDRFHWICKELKLEYKPKRLGGTFDRWTKKWDLRRLTKEYCAKMVKDKKNAYHEELKTQQVDFLKEKEEALAWMEKEKEDIARITEEITTTTKELENLTI